MSTAEARIPTQPDPLDGLKAVARDARHAHKVGISVIPPMMDTSKRPIEKWKQYQSTRCDENQVSRWWGSNQGWGAVCGKVSRGLEVLEFDTREVYDRFGATAFSLGHGKLVERIEAGCVDDTPSGGVHWPYYCEEVRGNTKLAERPDPSVPHGRKALIETRGEGGFCIFAPSYGKVHPSGRPYIRRRGSIDTIATLSPAERQTLFDLAITFDEMPKPEKPKATQTAGSKTTGDGLRPGDDFEARASWDDILVGWTVLHEQGGRKYLRRPGKDTGWSATINHGGDDQLYVFSTSTAFEPRKFYSKFAAYTRLEHGDDFSAAAKALAAKGYGEQRKSKRGTQAKPKATAGTNGDVLDDEGEGKRSQAEILLELAEGATLFLTTDGKPFASVPVNGHTEHHPIRSTAFKRWLVRAYYQQEAKPPSAEAVQAAFGVLEAQAQFDGETIRVYTRVGEAEHPNGPADPVFYLDLSDDKWRAIEISRHGWEVVSEPPVKFRRARGMLPLPVPEQGGDLESLREFVNLASDDDWYLFVAALTAALRPFGPYPILAFQGEQGSAKSTTIRVFRKMLDPHSTLLRSEPKEVRDLMIAATNAWCVTLDNLSRLFPWLSDALCRLSTGGGFATRTLYENDEETFFDAMRPVLLNGIEDVATRFDLLDRCIVLNLPTIPEDKRREETPLWEAFDEAHPKILGALLDAVVKGLATFPGVKLDRLPRMADFARWGEAVGRGLGWGEGTFLKAYESNRGDIDAAALESSAVAVALTQMIKIQPKPEWTGSAKELLEALALLVGEPATKQKEWPKSPRGLSGALHRAAPALRRFGITFTSGREENNRRKRWIHVIYDPKKAGETSSEPSTSSTGSPEADGKPSAASACADPLFVDDLDPASPEIVHNRKDRPQPESKHKSNGEQDLGQNGEVGVDDVADVDDLSPISEGQCEREIL
jgi:hypothetical protein